MLTELELGNEIGAVALGDLSKDEITYICETATTQAQAGQLAFSLLWKKYKPTYRLGKLYKKDGDKYENYRRLFLHYSRTSSAGKVGVPTSTITETVVDRYKWVK